MSQIHMQEKQKELNSNQQQKKKMKLWKKIVISVSGLIVAVLAAFTILFFHPLRTGFSVKQISDAPAFYAKISGTFSFDKYLKTGASNWGELTRFLDDSLYYGLGRDKDKQRGCSGFTATTPEGDHIACHNLDTNPLGQSPMVIEADYKNKVLGISNMMGTLQDDNLSIVKRVTCHAAPYFLCDGMNEHGLAVFNATAQGGICYLDEERITLYADTIAQAVLSNATDVEEAIEFLKVYNVVHTHAMSHFLIADASGASVVVEWYEGKIVVIEPTQEYSIFSNFMMYNNPLHKGFGGDRYENYEIALSECGGIMTEEEALELLKDNTIKGDECWSVVYNLTKKTMQVTFHNDYENVYTYEID